MSLHTGPTEAARQRRWLRLGCLGVSLGLAAAAWLAWTVSEGPVSILRGIAIVLSGLLSVGALGLSCGSVQLWDSIQRSLVHGAERLSTASVHQSTRSGIGLLVIGWLGGLVLMAMYLSTPNDETVGDQGAYLETAHWINDQGGLPALPGLMVRGEYAESNRHPLFIAILSLHPGFPWGRGLSAGFGLLTLVLGGVWLTRHHGLFAAGIFTVLLATNKLFLLSSSRVVCEGLLGLLCLWTWQSTVIDPRGRTSSARLRQPALLGGLGGLIWLTKGTGLPIAGALGLWWIGCTWRTRRLCALGLLMLVVMFLLTSSLLIVRNMERFGEPFYNLNTLLLFADEFDELKNMEAEGMTPRDAARQYLATHSISDVAGRAATGVIWEIFILLRSLGPAPWGDARLLWGGPLFLIGVTTLIVRRDLSRSVLLLWLLILIPMFGWYVPIAAGDRFLVPVIPGLLATAAMGVGSAPVLCERWLSRKTMEHGIVAMLSLWMLAAVAMTIVAGPNEFSPG